MGFKDVKQQLIDCLKTGSIQHEARGNIDIKNVLATGDISLIEVTHIVRSARGDEYISRPHDMDESIAIHPSSTVQPKKRSIFNFDPSVYAVPGLILVKSV